jgi:allophanate hydrolase subunit 1
MRNLIYTAIVGLFLAVSCVTTADIDALADIHQQSIQGVVEAQESYQQRVEALLADADRTEAERLAGLREAAEVRNKALEEIAKVAGTSVDQLVQLITARTQAAVEGVGTVTGNPLIDLLVNTLLAAGLGAVGADRLRDRRRLLRGEPVGSAIPLHPPDPH